MIRHQKISAINIDFNKLKTEREKGMLHGHIIYSTLRDHEGLWHNCIKIHAKHNMKKFKADDRVGDG